MSKFITGKELEEAVYHIIWDAEVELFIVCPFIQLGEYFKKLFQKHINNHKLSITVIFGKNEENVSRSLRNDDFDFFKQFPNVSIIYVPNLHAKYFCNEKRGVITSINLHDFSFKNNIEFGVYSEWNLIDSIKTSLVSSTDQAAKDMCIKIANENEVVFVQRPVYEKTIFSPITGKRFIKSSILHDCTSDFYGTYQRKKGKVRFLAEFSDSLDLGSTNQPMPTRDDVEVKRNVGFCIRCKDEIKMDKSHPYCRNCFYVWNQNINYREKYCHSCGDQYITRFIEPYCSRCGKW